MVGDDAAVRATCRTSALSRSPRTRTPSCATFAALLSRTVITTVLFAPCRELEKEVKANRLEAAARVQDLDARLSAAEISAAAAQLSIRGSNGGGSVAKKMVESVQGAGAMPEQPLPYTEAATGELHKADMQIHGVKITFAVRSWQHLGLLKEHVSREVNGYAIVKDAIESAQKKDPSKVRSQ